VKTNIVKENFVTGSRNMMAITRGVSCALASCKAISKAEQTKTMKVNIDEAIISSTALAVSGWMADSKANLSSSRWSSGTATSASAIPRAGWIPKRISEVVPKLIALEPRHGEIPELSTSTRKSTPRIWLIVLKLISGGSRDISR